MSVSADPACCDGGASGMAEADAQRLADRLAAIADPIRLQILSIIAASASGEVCACDFVGPVARSQPTVSHHLKVLAEAGMVDGDKRGRWVWYRLAERDIDDVMIELRGVVTAR